MLAPKKLNKITMEKPFVLVFFFFYIWFTYQDDVFFKMLISI